MDGGNLGIITLIPMLSFFVFAFITRRCVFSILLSGILGFLFYYGRLLRAYGAGVARCGVRRRQQLHRDHLLAVRVLRAVAASKQRRYGHGELGA